MKTSSSLFLAALLTSSALLLSAAAQTGSGGSAGSAGSSAGATGTTSASGTSATTSTSAGLPTAGTVNNSLPTATNPGASPTTTSNLPAATTTTLPDATSTTIQTTTTNQLPTVSTGSLPTATDMPLPTSSTDTSLNRAQVSSDARVLNSSTTNVPSPTDTTSSTRVSPGTPPLGPQPASIDVNSSIAPTANAGVSTTTSTANPIPSANPARGAADATLTPTGDLPNAATRPGEAPLLTNRVDTIVVSTPPPAPLQETRPPSPGAGQIWVPGHYTFAQSQWIWINGAWSTPPSTSARWVDGRYDAATRRWTEGHWDLNSGASVIP